MSAYREEGRIFWCGQNRLVGIAAIPETMSAVGVLVLVGGPQYRVGSHRQFTLLARSLAEAGIPTMRFDYTGMGDSEGLRRGFDETESDISAAIEALCETGVSRVVLWGLCDGASSAMMFAHRLPNVTGMILLNPWVHNGVYSPEVKLAHFYRPSFARKDQWHRLLSGKIDLTSAFRELASDTLGLIGGRALRIADRALNTTFIDDMLEGLEQFHHKALIILSEADLTAREFSTLASRDPRWKAAVAKSSISVRTILAADHTFSQKPWQDEVSQLTIEWVKQLSLHE
jgi:exosortase A-associated hydrolase 1